MNRSTTLLAIGLLGLLLVAAPAVAQSGLRPQTGRIEVEPGQPGQPGPPVSELALIDTSVPQGDQLLRKLFSTEQLVHDLDLTLTPNPTTGVAMVQLSTCQPLTATLAVRDVLGRVVLAPAPHTLPAGSHAIDLNFSTQPAGVYFVTVESAGYRHVRRLLKQ